MAARKGITQKVVQWLRAHPTDEVTGRFLEDLYALNGGSVYPADHPRKQRRGRVSQDSVQAFIDRLPVVRVQLGAGEKGGRHGTHYDRATFKYRGI